jgi:hypothetical protein
VPKAIVKIRLDKNCGPGEYEVVIAKDSIRLDEEGNLYLSYILKGPPKKLKEPVSLATTPAKTLKVKASGFRRRGY